MLKRFTILTTILSIFVSIGITSCGSSSQQQAQVDEPFVTVKDGEFYIGEEPYRYVGTNFWYGAILASEGRGGDRTRLEAELDSLQAIGIGNLRILVGGDGPDGVPTRIEPTLQPQAGVYNDTILRGLDYLLCRLEERGMKAVLYLNNSWEWSGGYGCYLEWAGKGPAVIPSRDGYQAYMDFAKQFVLDSVAKELSYNHVRAIVSRTNTVTGKPYSQSPAIMSWQVANEPRAFSEEGKDSLAAWIRRTAQIIKSIDPNHLVSTGSEGKHGCEVDIDLWAKIHSYPEIDYANIHIWPYNWSWINKQTVTTGVDSACIKTREYIAEHYEAIKSSLKPLVLEEFGYPRDGFAYAPGSPTVGRDAYYDYVLSMVGDSASMIAGCNFWGWGGLAAPAHEMWQRGDDYTGDPAQEAQGLNSVFAADTSTITIIKKAAIKANSYK